MPNDANAEWRAALDGVDARTTDAGGAAWPSGWGWYMQAIAAAAKLGLFNDYDLLYPRPFEADVQRGAELTGLPTG